MKWFMSYVKVYRDGRFKFGCVTYPEDEHPLARAKRWSETHGQDDGFTVVVLSFQLVDESCPEAVKTCPEVDALSHGIS